ncbi:hypothetical protein [Ulvibacterium sp.]|uniref:hypothetical protein n=1 Tax=Ulvibacterium sp. TaxID=2665914 RepID=UPI003BA9ADBD
MKTSQIFLFALIGINLALRSQSIPVTGDGYHYYGPNSTWNEYLKVGGHERGTDRASIVATNGNLHVDSKNGFGLYLNHYSKGKTLINPQGGNVGIGTTNPASNLHLVEDGDVVYLRGNSFRTSSGGFGILGYGARGSESSPSTLTAGDNTLWVRGMGFDGTNYHRVAHIGFNAESVAAGAVPGYIAFQTNDGNGINNLVERMRISSNGNVGIGTGTVSPLAPLSVKSNSVSSTNSGLLLEANNSNNALVKIAEKSTNGARLHMYEEGIEKIAFYTDGTSNHISAGNVGIGTTAPDEKLTVKGRIHAEEVKVDLSVPGPDYVFKEGYDLKSLEEVQQHIQEKGHLPNIPSAQEMEKNGVELGLMNMKLLEKIEELTLYMIEVNKQVKQLKRENSELKKELTKLK